MALDLRKIVDTALKAAGSAVSGVLRTVTYVNFTNPTYNPVTGLSSGGKTTYTVDRCVVLQNNKEDRNQDTSSTSSVSVLMPLSGVSFTPSTVDQFSVSGEVPSYVVTEWEADPSHRGYLLVKGRAA